MTKSYRALPMMRKALFVALALGATAASITPSSAARVHIDFGSGGPFGNKPNKPHKPQAPACMSSGEVRTRIEDLLYIIKTMQTVDLTTNYLIVAAVWENNTYYDYEIFFDPCKNEIKATRALGRSDRDTYKP